MAITTDDFNKIWASTSPLTPYEFSESNYKEGWNFIGGTPPSRQMWDFLQKQNDEKMKYITDNYATTDYVDEEIRQHGNLPIGYEYFQMNPNIPQGSLPMLGGVYSRETYADLWDWVQTQTGYLITDSAWVTLSNTQNGNVPFYSDGDGSTTFRVPSLKCWVKGANGTETVGTYLDAGLPNITGSVDSEYIISNNYSGVFSYTDVASSKYGSGATSWHNGISFDASKSNSIYGNANTVVPESIVGMWLVKAYGTVVDTGTIDEQAYIDDRYNAMKQYVDDEIGDVNAKIDTVSTYELSMSPVSTNVISFIRKGNLCMANIGGVSNLPSGNTEIATYAPQRFRPIVDVHTVYIDQSNRRIFVEIETSGKVRFYNYGTAITSGTAFYETLTYICAD